jgi:hypothetical protein
MNLPEVVEAVQESGFVAQQNSAFFSFWNMDLWPGGHVAQSLVRQSKPVVQSGSRKDKCLHLRSKFTVTELTKDKFTLCLIN